MTFFPAGQWTVTLPAPTALAWTATASCEWADQGFARRMYVLL
jgi:hypothetical protein